MSVVSVHGPNTWGDGGVGTAGSPGTFSGGTPYNLAILRTRTASPLTAWTVGQNVVLGDASTAYWNGTIWLAGVAP